MIRAFDGTEWSDWTGFNFTAQPNALPVATLESFGMFPNQWAQIDYPLYNGDGVHYSDADGDAPVYYQFMDSGNVPNGPKLWSVDGGFQAPGTVLTITAAETTEVYVGGSSAANTEIMYVRAYDGHDWGAWDPFYVSNGYTGP
jgi:hypothetical protein